MNKHLVILRVMVRIHQQGDRRLREDPFSKDAYALFRIYGRLTSELYGYGSNRDLTEVAA